MSVIERVSKSVTIRGRCFLLSFVAESVLQFIDHENARGLAKNAVEAIQNWQTDPSSLTGEQVYQWSGDNENEDGLVFIEQELDEGSDLDNAVLCVLSAVMYVAWHAYMHDGVEPQYAALASVDESVFMQTVNYALKIAGLDENRMEAIASFLAEQHRATSHTEFGECVQLPSSFS
ncbi:MAG: Imm6 family immunity protein [Fuerstiella sp.]